MSHVVTRKKLFWLAAASGVALVSLLLTRDYLHVPLAFFPFFLVWSWTGRKSEACKRRPEYGVCAPHAFLATEDKRG
jgi:hypothetical protein